MAKNNRGKKTGNLGKGNVTPVQVAFMVDRYLSDNNYRNALAAFRSDAADLFSKTKGKEVPRGLLGLGEILDEYIRMKGQKIMLEQEKKRLETAMNGLQEVMRAYQSGTSSPLPSSPPLIPPQFVGSSFLPLPNSNPSNGSPPGSVMNYSAVSTNTMVHNISTPSYNINNNKKRNSSNLLPPAPKKFCSVPNNLPSVPITGTTQEKNTSSIAKNLFTSDQISKTSPETPQNNQIQTEIQNSKCSIISSSEKLIMSPNKAYYSVERSYQITSPYKNKPSAKGKLDFESTDLEAGQENILTGQDNGLMGLNETGISNSSPELDFDFPDFDIPDFSFSELLIDLDLGQSDQQAPNIVSLDQENEGSKLTVEDYTDDANIQGPESVTSFRAITKRIKIMSPVKTRRNS